MAWYRLNGRISKLLAAAVVTISATALLDPAFAQDKYPSRAVEIIVPWPAGGSTDLGARVYADALQERWGVPVKVINRPGGNTLPGVLEVMRAAPDGHTILMDGPGSSSMLDTVVKDPPVKVMERTFLALAANTPQMLIVPADSEFKSLHDLVTAIRQDPASLLWASGPGTTDMTFRRLFQLAGVDHRKTRPVQVRGGAETVNITAGGHVRVGAGFWGTVAPLIAAKRLRILAVAGPSRFPAAPDVPTTAEAGLPDFVVLQWIGLSGPPGMAPAVIAKWQEAFAELSKNPKVLTSLERLGLVPFAGGDMRQFVELERTLVRELWAN